MPRHSSFMIMHTFAEWETRGRIWREALELLQFRLLRIMGGIGIKAKEWGEILSSKGLLTSNVVEFVPMKMRKKYKNYCMFIEGWIY